MEKLYQLTAAAYEDKYITVPDTLVYHTAEKTDTLAHISLDDYVLYRCFGTRWGMENAEWAHPMIWSPSFMT